MCFWRIIIIKGYLVTDLDSYFFYLLTNGRYNQAETALL